MISRLKIFFLELSSACYDLVFFLKHSFKKSKLNEKSKFSAHLTKQYHVVEKGLALPKPRPGFGEKKIKLLIRDTRIYEQQFGTDFLTQNVVSVIKSYVDFHIRIGFKLNEEYNKVLLDFYDDRSTELKGLSTGGVEVYKHLTSEISTHQFLMSRKSVRNFKDTHVSHATILQAIDIAKYAPSVCNRQGWKAHMYDEPNQIASLLDLQTGNKGFSHLINTLIIITGDMNFFTDFERNQLYVDGGLFAQNLMLALHSYGLVTCPLNTCRPFHIENKIKSIGHIDRSERLIMFLAVGEPRHDVMVPKSQRRSSESFLIKH
ncbi:MAG: nitroreductase family protein [Roseivirga sp.]|jgi:nitroreductase|uniref:nitroreductase family protein n=1 Tax=Roseivirga sp. TaxID=1964215 RepID=UPI001B0B2CF5|nr:nitroreductase family protein [Roseivirga sp.]MBO6497731.1 nitroreductase family protein [Roseivirga sp.]